MAVELKSVFLLHVTYCALTSLIAEFPDDRSALLSAAQAVIDVGLKHDVEGRFFFRSEEMDT